MYSAHGNLNVPDTSGDLQLIQKHLLNGDLMKLRDLWKDKIDFVYVFKYLFNVFIPEYISPKSRAEASIIVAEYLYRDRSVMIKEINCVACILEIMNLLNVRINFEKT